MTTLPTATATTVPGAVTVDLEGAAQRAAHLAEAGTAEATRRAYRTDWDHFTSWCAAAGLDALPAAPTTAGLYIAAHESTHALATLQRRLASISTLHRLAGHHLDTRHPAIAGVLRGLRRTKGTSQRQVEAITVPMLRALVDTCGDDLLGVRDRALLLVGFASALRRSELVGLEIGDVAITEAGARITVLRSKTDQDGAGQVVGVARTGTATCPVAALETWLTQAGIVEGRVFRRVDRHGRIGASLSDDAVALVVKKRAALAGLDPTGFAGHSLRAGFATSAAIVGVEERVIAEVTRHRSGVVRRYIRAGGLFRRNLAAEVGL